MDGLATVVRLKNSQNYQVDNYGHPLASAFQFLMVCLGSRRARYKLRYREVILDCFKTTADRVLLLARNTASILLLMSFLLMSHGVHAQQSLPQGVPTEQAIAPHTAEVRLKLGRLLLEKLTYVLSNVSLHDSVTVLGAFGFAELVTKEYPTYTEVQPKGTRWATASPDDLIGTGWSFIRSDPAIRGKSHEFSGFAGMNGRFNLDEVCVSLADVRLRFDSAENVTVFPSITAPGDSDRVLQTPGHDWRENEVGAISFYPLSTPHGRIGMATFGFNHRECAMDFGAGYLDKYKEISK